MYKQNVSVAYAFVSCLDGCLRGQKRPFRTFNCYVMCARNSRLLSQPAYSSSESLYNIIKPSSALKRLVYDCALLDFPSSHTYVAFQGPQHE